MKVDCSSRNILSMSPCKLWLIRTPDSIIFSPERPDTSGPLECCLSNVLAKCNLTAVFERHIFLEFRNFYLRLVCPQNCACASLHDGVRFANGFLPCGCGGQFGPLRYFFHFLRQKSPAPRGVCMKNCSRNWPQQ